MGHIASCLPFRGQCPGFDCDRCSGMRTHAQRLSCRYGTMRLCFVLLICFLSVPVVAALSTEKAPTVEISHEESTVIQGIKGVAKGISAHAWDYKWQISSKIASKLAWDYRGQIASMAMYHMLPWVTGGEQAEPHRDEL
jgi:hypothetical protein